MNVVPALVLRFHAFDDKRVRFRIPILANSRDLPGYFHTGLASGDAEAVVQDLLRDIQPWRRRPDRRQLVAEGRIPLIEFLSQTTPPIPAKCNNYSVHVCVSWLLIPRG